jgi:hypothetical protein
MGFDIGESAGAAIDMVDRRGIRVRIPTEAGRVFRREAGQRSDVKPATIPI